MVDGATSEWILYASEMLELVENRPYANADDSTLVAVVRKPADNLLLLSQQGLNRDLARIQEWCNHRCTLLISNKTIKGLVVSKSRTVNPIHGDIVLSGDSICTSPNLDILSLKFDSTLTFGDHVRGIVSRVSQRIGILRLVKRVFVDTSVLIRCYCTFVLKILEYYFRVWGSAAECHLQLLECQVIRWQSFAQIRLSSSCVIDVMLLHRVYCTRLIQTQIIVCSVSFHLLLSEFDIPNYGCSSSTRVRSIKVKNVQICKLFPAGPDSCVE